MRIVWKNLLWFIPHFSKKTAIIVDHTNDYIDYEIFESDVHTGLKNCTYATVEGLFWLGFIYVIDIYDYRTVL